MKRRRLVWQLFRSYLLISFVTLLIITSVVTHQFKNYVLEGTFQSLEKKGQDIVMVLHETPKFNQVEYLQYQSVSFAKMTGERVSFIDPKGQLLADSHADLIQAISVEKAPEIQGALAHHTGKGYRFSQNMLEDYACVAIWDAKSLRIIRVGSNLKPLHFHIQKLYLTIVLIGLSIILLGGLISYLISKQVGQSLDTLIEGAERFAKGKLKGKLEVPNSEDFGPLAAALNEMAKQLDERYQHVLQERNEKTAILSNMEEALISVDPNRQLVTFNDAAKQLFNKKAKVLIGQPLDNVMDHQEVLGFVDKTMTSKKTIEAVIEFPEQSRFFQVHGSAIRDRQKKVAGALIVLNDITQMKRLEQLRKEFVANVSHELKTPITVIKGFVETLEEGALKEPEKAERFLSIIKGNTDQLSKLVQDLLLLSEIEHGEEEGLAHLEFHEESIRSVLSASMDWCLPAAEDKQIKMTLSCEDGLYMQMKGDLIEHAMTNLLQNAIRYSPEGSEIEIELRKESKWIHIDVKDDGEGIDAEHLPHLFTRFYRVDKGRSRRSGGTGLGLAIVKHITQLHQGKVDVKSAPGKGSQFRMSFPSRKKKA